MQFEQPNFPTPFAYQGTYAYANPTTGMPPSAQPFAYDAGYPTPAPSPQTPSNSRRRSNTQHNQQNFMGAEYAAGKRPSSSRRHEAGEFPGHASPPYSSATSPRPSAQHRAAFMQPTPLNTPPPSASAHYSPMPNIYSYPGFSQQPPNEYVGFSRHQPPHIHILTSLHSSPHTPPPPALNHPHPDIAPLKAAAPAATTTAANKPGAQRPAPALHPRPPAPPPLPSPNPPPSKRTISAKRPQRPGSPPTTRLRTGTPVSDPSFSSGRSLTRTRLESGFSTGPSTTMVAHTRRLARLEGFGSCSSS